MRKTWAKIWAWCRKYWHLIALFFAGVAITCAIYNNWKNKKEVLKLRLEKDILSKRADVVKLEGKKEILNQDLDKNAEEIRLIDLAIKYSNNKIEEKKTRIEDLSMREKLDKFKDMGYK